MMEFKNLSVGFSQQALLEGLNGRVAPGQLIALMGINGRGKSCLIKTLTGLVRPIKGEVWLDGRSLSDYSPLELAKKLSLVLTEKIDIDFLGVEELLCLGRSPYTGLSGSLQAEDKRIITETCALLKINGMRNSLFSELSDGQKQRVLMARAFIQAPEFLFLDEPTTFLDIPSKVDLMKWLKLMSVEKKIGIVFSTHDLELIKDQVDLIWLIDNEGTFHQGGPEYFKSSGLLEKNFSL